MPIRKRAIYDGTNSQGGQKAQKQVEIFDMEPEYESYVSKMSKVGEEIYLMTLNNMYLALELFDYHSAYCAMTIQIINKLPKLIEAYLNSQFLTWFQTYVESHWMYEFFVADVYLWQSWIASADPYVAYLKSVLPAPRRQLNGHDIWNVYMSDSDPGTLLHDGIGTIVRTFDGWQLATTGNANIDKEFDLKAGSPEFDMFTGQITGWGPIHLDDTYNWKLDIHLNVEESWASNNSNWNKYYPFSFNLLGNGINFQIIGGRLECKVGSSSWTDVGLYPFDAHCVISVEYRIGTIMGAFYVAIDGVYSSTSFADGGTGNRNDFYGVTLKAARSGTVRFKGVHLY